MKKEKEKKRIIMIFSEETKAIMVLLQKYCENKTPLL